MGAYEWAENEVYIAINKIDSRESNEDDFDKETGEYIKNCYKSALRAYKSLCEDDHSGMSFSITSGILKRLMANKPLEAIEDVPESWNKVWEDHGIVHYKCNRVSSLYKEVYPNGKVKYSDIDRVECHNIGRDNHCVYYNGFIADIIDEMFPIKFPYAKDELYTVETNDFQFDPKYGDYDTKAIFYVKSKSGEKTPINKFYADKGGNSMIEISEEEYNERLKLYKERKGK